MKPLRPLPTTIAALALGTLALAADKVPAPPPQMADVKTPAPLTPPKPAPAPGTEASDAGAGVRRPSPAKLPEGAPRVPAIDRERLYFDEVAGATWVRGRDWKASFSADGATYVPYFGGQAPQNYPIAFHVAEARRGAAAAPLAPEAAVARSGGRVELDRGGVVERYDLEPGSLMQSFVFDAPFGAAGDLVLALDVETELAASRDADGSIVFGNEHGRVRYGAATVLDAAGRSQAIETALEGDRLELRVPESFLAAATWPVTIDPVVSVFGIDNYPDYNDYDPDVSYDATAGRWIVVYEEDYSSTDHDVYATVLNDDGSFHSGLYVDQTTEFWGEPHVANNAYTAYWMVVAHTRSTVGSPWRIQGRHLKTTTLGTSGYFLIDQGLPGDCFHPVIGGDATFVPPSYFLVVWQRNLSSGDNDIHARLVVPNGGPTGSTIFVDNSGGTLDWLPAVSKSSGQLPWQSQEWIVVWSRTYDPTDWDVYGARLSWDGTILASTFTIDYSTFHDTDVEVSSILDGGLGARKWMLALNRQVASDWEIVFSMWQGSSYLDSGYVSQIEGLGLGGEVQFAPSVDSDGQKFAIAYSESYLGSGSDFDTWITTLQAADSNVLLAEAHGQLGYTTGFEGGPAVASRRSGGGAIGGFLTAWNEQTAPSYDGNIDGGLFEAIPHTEFCHPGIDAIACPCGNAPAFGNRGCDNSVATGGGWLQCAGSVLGDNVTLLASSMLPSVTTVFLQGTSYAGAGAAFGDGVRCIGGTLLRLGVKQASGGQSHYPGAGDPTISQRSAALGQPIAAGTQRFYQTYYRDPSLGYACLGNSTFNVTNGVIVDW